MGSRAELWTWLRIEHPGAGALILQVEVPVAELVRDVFCEPVAGDGADLGVAHANCLACRAAVGTQPSGNLNSRRRWYREVRRSCGGSERLDETAVDEQRGAVVQHEGRQHVHAGATVTTDVLDGHLSVQVVATGRGHDRPLLLGIEALAGRDHGVQLHGVDREVLGDECVAVLTLVELVELPGPELYAHAGQGDHEDAEPDPAATHKEPQLAEPSAKLTHPAAATARSSASSKSPSVRGWITSPSRNRLGVPLRPRDWASWKSASTRAATSSLTTSASN